MKTTIRVLGGAAAAGIGAGLAVMLIGQPAKPKIIQLPPFRYSPSVVQSNYSWTIEGSTNLRDWEFLEIGASTNYDAYFHTNGRPLMFYRSKGVPK